ncbi:MAG: thymidylate synthase [Parcubacteria group bacterium]|nr:thymidylate synthase [Parcubacteria group bacterium]
MTQFDRQYQAALLRILNQGYDEYNERTGHRTKTLPGITFELDEGFPLLTLRSIPVKLFVAEQAWFIMGSKNPKEFLDHFTKIWDDFTEADGTVAAAYGYRWRHHFGRDQLGGLIEHLTREPHSRQGVVVTWDPADDGLYGEGLKGTYKKNVPCPFTFTVNIIGGRLHLHNVVRSNDMLLGCPHDVAGFALLMHILAAKLGVAPGKYTHSISNAHIYDIHESQAWELTERTNSHPMIFFEAQPDYYERAERGDLSLVTEIVDKLMAQYHPLPALKGLTIVL